MNVVKIFKIIDGTHYQTRDELIQYSDFVMRYEDLDLVFKAYEVWECEPKVFIYERSNSFTSENVMLNNFLVMFKDLTKDNLYC